MAGIVLSGAKCLPVRRPHFPVHALHGFTALAALMLRPPNMMEALVYETPKLERLGTFREITLAGGDFNPGDGGNPFHRYAPLPS